MEQVFILEVVTKVCDLPPVQLYTKDGEIRCSYLRVIPLMMKRHAENSKISLKSVNDFVPIIYTFLERFRQYSVLEICPNRY